MSFIGLCCIGFSIATVLFGIGIGIYFYVGWRCMKWYLLLGVLIPCIPYMHGAADGGSDSAVLFITIHGLFTVYCWLLFGVYNMIKYYHVDTMNEFLDAKVAKLPEPSEITLIAIKYHSYPEDSRNCKISGRIEREYLVSLWKKQQKKEIMSEDPWQWIWWMRERNKEKQEQ